MHMGYIGYDIWAIEYSQAMTVPESVVETSPDCRRRETVEPLSAFQVKVVALPTVKL